MIRSSRRNAGFTIIELSMVLIVLGILASVFLPMTQANHENAMRERDMASMESAKNALIGYIRVNGGAPCVDAAGNQVATGCDPKLTLDLLGVRSTDSRGMTFAFDVNETLTVAEITASGNSICTALANIISPPAPPAPLPPLDPQVCDSTNANTGSTACAATHPMAFVLVGRGNDRCFNLENTNTGAANDAVCTTAVAVNRTFENPVRLHSRTQDDSYYEDLVYILTPTELAEFMDCPIGGGAGDSFICSQSGEKFVNVVNGTDGKLCAKILHQDTTDNRYSIWSGTTSGAGCQDENEILSIHNNNSCSGNIVLGPSTLATLDQNGDGRADILCDKNANCSAR
jgi:prepilin-type N-terminal cleavage/methylation domain-containing protein